MVPIRLGQQQNARPCLCVAGPAAVRLGRRFQSTCPRSTKQRTCPDCSFAEHGAAGVNLKVSQLISVQKLVACSSDDTLEEARHLMNVHHIRHLPVIDDFALAGVALFYDEDRQGRVRNAHVGVIGACDRPHRLPEVEAMLNGHSVEEPLIREAAATAALIQTARPPSLQSMKRPNTMPPSAPASAAAAMRPPNES